MKRIFVFIMAAFLLISSAPVKEVRAEEYLTVFEVLDNLGIPYDENTNGYSNLSSTYFFFCTMYDANGNLLRNVLYVNNRCPNGWNGGFTTGGYSTGNWPVAQWFYDSNGLTLRVPAGGQPSNGVLYINNASKIDVVYANFDTSFLANVALFNDIENDDVIPEVHTHSWSSKETAATCTSSGKTWEECECGEIQNEVEIPALGHSLVQKSNPSTCTVPGLSWEECSVCGVVENETTLDLAPHTWEQKEELGSCVVDSRTWEECSVCAAVQNEVITPASGHVWITYEEPATCTEDGRSWEECGCGEIQNEVVLNALGHSWEEKQEPSTCIVPGKSWEECSVCSIIQNELSLDLAEHSFVIKSIPAKCTETGISWEECSVCGFKQNETEIPALGHGILIYQVIQQPTVSEEGIFIRKCSVCHEVVETGSISTIRPTPTPRPTATRPSTTPS